MLLFKDGQRLAIQKRLSGLLAGLKGIPENRPSHADDERSNRIQQIHRPNAHPCKEVPETAKHILAISEMAYDRL